MVEHSPKIFASEERATSSVGRESDRHAAEAGSIPLCGEGFFSQGQRPVQTFLFVSVQPSCAIACITICTHVKDPKHWQPYLCSNTRKYRTHYQEWVALLLWLLLPYPGKATPISHKG